MKIKKFLNIQLSFNFTINIKVRRNSVHLICLFVTNKVKFKLQVKYCFQTNINSSKLQVQDRNGRRRDTPLSF